MNEDIDIVIRYLKRRAIKTEKARSIKLKQLNLVVSVKEVEALLNMVKNDTLQDFILHCKSFGCPDFD